MLYDGATNSARLDHYTAAGEVARAAVTALLDSALPRRRPRPGHDTTP